MPRFFKALSPRPSRIAHSLHVALLIGVSVLILFAAQASAQNSTADILGDVTDSTGAILPNVTVTLTSVSTQERKSFKTTSAGAYLFSNLTPGPYTVSLQSAGFETVTVNDIVVSADDRRRIDIKMTVGTANMTIEVDTTTPTLQTDTSSIIRTIDQGALDNLPLNGRNYNDLIRLAAGANEGSSNAINNGTRPDDRRPASSVSINGQSEAANDNMIDGLDNNERIVGTIGVRPSLDAIKEVKLQTNNYSAEAGRSAGAAINVITKSGTNKLHGSVYEYFRNDKLNTYSYEFGAMFLGKPIPKPELRQNQFGGSLGGPIVKNRTFFFGDAEFFRLVKGGAPTEVTIPTAYEEQHPGDFSDNIPVVSAAFPGSNNCTQTTTSVGGVATLVARANGGTNFNPATQIAGCAYNAANGQLYANNVIPTTALDPVGAQYFKLYPVANATSTSATGVVIPNQYVNTRNSVQFSTVYDIRVDHKISEKDNIFGRYTENSLFTFSSPSALPNVVVNKLNIDPQGGQISPEVARNAQVNYSHAFTPRVLGLLGLGYTYITNASYSDNFGLNPNTSFGEPGINFSTLTSALGGVSPNGGTALGGSTFLPLQYKDNTYQINAGVYFSKGNQSFKVGGSMIERQALNQQDNSGVGSFSFQAGYPGLLTGFFSAASRNNSLIPPTYLTYEPSVYAQDDWRVTSRLTLNFGVRYDIYTPYIDKHNHLSNLNFNTLQFVVAGSPGVTRSADVNTDYKSVAPRIGFAFTAMPGTILSGGFGMSYFPTNYQTQANLKSQPFTVTYGSCTSITCPAGYSALQNGLPIPGTLAGNALNPQCVVTGSSLPAGLVNPVYSPQCFPISIPSTVDFNYRNGALEQFNLTVQQEIARSVLSISYVGNLGRHLQINETDYNRIPYTNTLSGTAANQARRFYLELPNVTNINHIESTGNSNYNALQVSFERRFNSGLGFSGNTTWAHLLDDANEGALLATQHQTEYGNGTNDQRNRIVAQVSYQPTFGKEATGFKGALIKGYRFNVINVWSTALPFSITNATNVADTSPAGGGSDRANIIGNPFTGLTAGRFLNSAAFAAEPQVPSIGFPLADQRRNQFFGPHYRHTDAALSKDFSLPEGMRMQFRAEAYNLTNTTNFGNPNTSLSNTATFGTITALNALYTPRLIQFALRLEF